MSKCVNNSKNVWHTTKSATLLSLNGFEIPIEDNILQNMMPVSHVKPSLDTKAHFTLEVFVTKSKIDAFGEAKISEKLFPHKNVLFNVVFELLESFGPFFLKM